MAPPLNDRVLYYLTVLAALTLSSFTQAQRPVSYDLFNRPVANPSTKISIISPQLPSFPVVAPINVMPSSMASGISTDNSISTNNQRLIAQDLSGASYQTEEERARILHQELMEDDFYRRHVDYLEKSQNFRKAYIELSRLNPDSFSVTKAVFITENAWYDNKYTFDAFQKRMDLEAKIVKGIMKKEKLKENDEVALNYAIQKRFREGGQFYDPKSKTYKQAVPLKYDFNDIMGEKDYSQLFATKMLITGKGQCRSLPLVYLMIAETLGAKAWLSMAPQHSFVKFADKRGNLFNFEATNGNVVSTSWLHQSGYITAAALKNKVFLDTLSQRHLYAQLLADLLQGYLNKFRYDDFAENLKERILSFNPNNLTALMVDANLKRSYALQLIQQAGMPKEEELAQFPAAYKAYLAMQEAYQRIDDTGYQDMPSEAYQRWLKSFDKEKQKQENLELQRKLNLEIQQLKNHKPRSVVIDRTKG